MSVFCENFITWFLDHCHHRVHTHAHKHRIATAELVVSLHVYTAT